MSNRVFYYYYAPTWDLPPDGPVRLGNILTSIKKPEKALYTAPLPNDSEVYASEKRDVVYSQGESRRGRFSILTKFLSVLGVGVDIGAEWSDSNEDIFMFDRMETKQFTPKDSYIQKCIESGPVRRYLDRSRYRQPIYLITGIKTVYGAMAKTVWMRTRGGMASVSVDGTVWSGGSVPISTGPEVETKMTVKQGTAWQGSSDFVFAFRVCKISVNRKTGAVSHYEDYTKGTMLGDTPIKIKEDLPELQISSHKELKPAEEGYDEAVLMEGDKSVHCAIPRRAHSDDEY